MVSDISSLAPDLADALGRGPVPLLVLRLTDFSRVAWRDGKRAARRVESAATRAFREIAKRMLRAGDRIAHDAGSENFIILMTAPSRESPRPSPADCRAVLQRAAIALSEASGLHAETGWTLLRHYDAAFGLQGEVELALERGARERERYEFFAGVGHELRTPLTVIRGYLDALLDAPGDASTVRRFLETARREALRMGRLLDGMFEFSLLDLSGDAIVGAGCHLAAQIEAACEAMRPAAQSRGIRLRRRVCRSCIAAIEPDAFAQMLLNLLDNAIKYGSDGGMVSVQCRAGRGEVILTVDDDGPGIAPAERESIFGLRVRGAQTPGRPGTGIGLAIVKMIAERAGGSITAGASPLGGARFAVTLPAKAESGVAVS